MLSAVNIPLLLALGGALFALLAAALILRARFGRRRGDTPFCRKCRYNLTGNPAAAIAPSATESAPDSRGATPVSAVSSSAGDSPSADHASTPARCPECGSDLTRPRAILRGERPRRPVALAFGLIALVFALALAGSFAWLQFSNFNWYNLLPSSIVARDLDNQNTMAVERAFYLLRARLATQDIGARPRAKLIAAAITRLRNSRSALAPTFQQLRDYVFSLRLHLAWSSGQWFDGDAASFLLAEMRANRLTVIEKNAAAEAVALPLFEYRSLYSAAERFPITIYWPWLGDFGCWFHPQLSAVRVSPGPDWTILRPGDWEPGDDFGSFAVAPFDALGFLRFPAHAVIETGSQPGLYDVSFVFDVACYEASAVPLTNALPLVGNLSPPPADAKLFHRFEIEQKSRIEICDGPPENRIALDTSPEVTERVRVAYTGYFALMTTGNSCWLGPPDSSGRLIPRRLNSRTSMISYAMDISVESSGQQLFRWQQVDSPSVSKLRSWYGAIDRLPNFPPRVTIRMRPNRRLALEHLSNPDPPKSIYGNEIVLEDVEVVNERDQ